MWSKTPPPFGSGLQNLGFWIQGGGGFAKQPVVTSPPITSSEYLLESYRRPGPSRLSYNFPGGRLQMLLIRKLFLAAKCDLTQLL